MHTLRHILSRAPQNPLARLSQPKLVALLLVALLPGGLFVPICWGIYGALRHTISGKVAGRSVDGSALSDPVREVPLR